MTGWTSNARSPSTRATSLRTPCVDGCWGPMFQVMSSVSSSTETDDSERCRTRSWSKTTSCLRVLFRWAFRGFLVTAGHGFDVDIPRPGLHLAAQQRIALAQRIAHERVGKIEVGEIGMADELDAKHLMRLAL